MSHRFLLTFLVLAIAVQAFGDVVTAKSDKTLADIILMSSEDITRNPVRSTQCFGVYNPKLQKLTDEYEAEHERCMDITTNDTKALNVELEPKITEVTQLQDGICNDYSNCRADINNNVYNFFSCSNDVAGDAITGSYNVQIIAKDRMQYIQLRQQMIKYNQDTCTTKCSNAYIEDTAKVHSQLQDCLAGKTPVPTAPAPTTSAAPEE